MSAEQTARQTIDKLLTETGWAVQIYEAADIYAARGVAIREFELTAGNDTADRGVRVITGRRPARRQPRRAHAQGPHSSSQNG